MDRWTALLEALEKFARVPAGGRIAVDKDGTVHVAPGLLRRLSRKAQNLNFLNSDKQTRVKAVNWLHGKLEISNDITSGILRLPPIRFEDINIGAYDSINEQHVVEEEEGEEEEELQRKTIQHQEEEEEEEEEEETEYYDEEKEEDERPTIPEVPSTCDDEIERAHEGFFENCSERTRLQLQRHAKMLNDVCGAIVRLKTYTYADDIKTGGQLMQLVSYASLQRERIEKELAEFAQKQKEHLEKEEAKKE